MVYTEEERHQRIIESKRRYYQRNKEIIKYKNNEYYKNNKVHLDEYRRQWQKDNRINRILSCKKYYLKNREKELQRRKDYNQTPIGKISSLNNSMKRRLLYKDTDITLEWLLTLKQTTIHCSICNIELSDKGTEYNGKQLDHIIPLSVGGLHMKNNVRFICKTCNLRRPKDGRDLE